MTHFILVETRRYFSENSNEKLCDIKLLGLYYVESDRVVQCLQVELVHLILWTFLLYTFTWIISSLKDKLQRVLHIYIFLLYLQKK